MDADQAECPENQRLPLGNELRQEGHVENPHLGVEHVAQHALDKPVAGGLAIRLGTREGAARAQQHVHTQPGQVRSAAVLEQVEGDFRHRHQRTQAKRNRRPPQQATGVDPQRGLQRLALAFHRGSPEHQGRVEAGRERQQCGGEGEGEEVIRDGHGRASRTGLGER